MAKVTAYRQELKGRILKESIKEFKKNGIKQVKMDDIANNLSISKRTLYEIYPNKEELLLEGLRAEHEERNLEFMRFMAMGNRSVIDVFVQFFKMEMRSFATVSPLYFSDIHKFPNAVSYLSELHEESQSKSKEFLQKGVEEGFFREDVNFEIVSRMGQATMQHVMQIQLYKQYSLQHIFRNVILLLIRGICTQRGVKVVDEMLEKL
ncbi:TetR/AcrR family transcriptional regulator [Prevotella sp. KH2C16]|uniref:TetR/AcrR family transcriptional regulator n=1 Tax=Prevotella sp. KH2C16 TaxID=1855325 RepID=UPI0008ED6315|nr:TetR/AcrR family transcriptional regulator [Prevotella sp. KH2C16]SFG10190.1 DNA-binding transcriptional regulator, AcrR family [Prevotella sp. KH2C16]